MIQKIIRRKSGLRSFLMILGLVSFTFFFPPNLFGLNYSNNFSTASSLDAWIVKGGQGSLSWGGSNKLEVGDIVDSGSNYSEVAWDPGKAINGWGASVDTLLASKNLDTILTGQIKLWDWSGYTVLSTSNTLTNSLLDTNPTPTINTTDFTGDSLFDFMHIRYIGIRFNYPGGGLANSGQVDNFKVYGYSEAETPEPHVMFIASLALLGFCFHRGSLPWNLCLNKNRETQSAKPENTQESA